MINPIKNWPNLPRGFKFKQIYPKSFGSLAGKPHLGLDIVCPSGTPIVAWTDLSIISSYFGSEGGNTVQIKCPNNPTLFRMCHLQKPGICGKYKQGQIIAYVGNTGSATTGAHLHIDLSKNGILDIYNINNFTDPEVYFRGLKDQ